MTYITNQEVTDSWSAYHGDCIPIVSALPENSIGFSIFSPPFESLYTYSNSDRDMGNTKSSAEFWAQFKFLIAELYRVIKPGRLVSIHCMNLPTSKTKQGFIGVRDFRGEIIREFQNAGFYYHSEVCIWKDPVVAMQRTKALGLLHKQIKKDSCMSRQGIPDYLVTMRKPGVNDEPVGGPLEYFCGDPATFTQTKNLSIDVWQRYASPVWMDIRPGNTLQHRAARDQNDERHIAPLQLDVIERAIQLWTNEGDVVLTPFGGIGSEGYVAVKMGRKAILCELKESYFVQLVRNMVLADAESGQQMDLLGGGHV